MNAYHKAEPGPLRDELVRLRSQRADAEWQTLCDRLAVLAGPESSSSPNSGPNPSPNPSPAPGATSTAPADDPSLARGALESLCRANAVDTRGGVTVGLVHHFNNVLMGVLGASRMAARSLEPGDPARSYVDEITAGAEHGINLSHQVIDTARQTVARFEACSCADERATEAKAPAREPTSLRVLLVEDERLIRITLKHELQSLGHQVECAVDGNDAARLIEARSEPVDVLLTDVVVPGPTGPEIAELARAKWPSLRVIFMSAYPRDVLLQQGRIQPSQMTLEKPFTEEQLVAKLRDAWAGD